LAIAALLARAELVLEEGVVLSADYCEVVAHCPSPSFVPFPSTSEIGSSVGCRWLRRYRSIIQPARLGIRTRKMFMLW
jgi:hypothetical protein